MTQTDTPDISDIDRRHMATALCLAKRGLGNVWPNPAVGCVIVKDGHVVGRGWTQPGGRPHAETEALRRAGENAKGATAYVTLEPCDHQGQTPPCSKALIEAGISRVVVALTDPDPRVSGGGTARLKNAGISVSSDVLCEEARALNAGFLSRINRARPWISCKAATSLDGRIATGNGDSQWITGAGARAFGHQLRAENDAIVVGIETALVDAPSLTCRLPGMGHLSPVRVVVDSRTRLPVECPLVESAQDVPLWVISAEGQSDPQRADALRSRGARVLCVAADEQGQVDVSAMAQELAANGITRALVEGGGTLIASLITADLADQLHWFGAGVLIGADGRPAIGPMGIEKLSNVARYRLDNSIVVDGDVFSTYSRSSTS